MSVSLNNLSTAISTLQSDIATINNNNTSLSLVYCCGIETFGEFGLGGFSTNSFIQPNYAFPTTNNIIQVSAGKDHSLFLDSTGRAYSCGNTSYGKTGLNFSAGIPTEITFGDIVGRTIIQVSAGLNFSLFLDSTGRVYSCGYDTNGETGLNKTSTISTLFPTEITFGDIVGRTIIQVSAGQDHSLVLDSEGKVYTFGRNTSGKTGLNTATGDNAVPIELTFGDIVGRTIIQVSAGLDHSLVLDSEGKVYTFGRNTSGKTGLNITSGNTLVPTEITFGDIVGRTIIQVSAGKDHSLFLDSTGRAYSCGNNSYGITGLNTELGSTLVPTEITFGDIVGRTIIQVSAGESHSLFLDSTDRAYSCGNNSSGRTALNTTFGSTLVPTLILYFVFINKTIAHIIAGIDTSFFIAN